MTFLDWIRRHWDRVAAGVAVAIGLLALLIGWHGSADQVLPAGQIPFVVSGGIGGLFALGIGATLWIAAELRDQWYKLDRLERRLDDAARREEIPTSSTNGSGSDAPAGAARPRRRTTSGASPR